MMCPFYDPHEVATPDRYFFTSVGFSFEHKRILRHDTQEQLRNTRTRSHVEKTTFDPHIVWCDS